MRALEIFVIIALAALFAACDDGPEGSPADAGTDGDAEAPDCLRDEDCDDGVECTVEYCESGRCRRSNDDSVCDDGVRCNGVETCRGGDGCVDGQPVICDDGIECTADRCDVELDRCVSEANDDLCPSGYACDPTLGGCIPSE